MTTRCTKATIAFTTFSKHYITGPICPATSNTLLIRGIRPHIFHEKTLFRFDNRLGSVVEVANYWLAKLFAKRKTKSLEQTFEKFVRILIGRWLYCTHMKKKRQVKLSGSGVRRENMNTFSNDGLNFKRIKPQRAAMEAQVTRLSVGSPKKLSDVSSHIIWWLRPKKYFRLQLLSIWHVN